MSVANVGQTNHMIHCVLYVNTKIVHLRVSLIFLPLALGRGWANYFNINSKLVELIGCKECLDTHLCMSYFITTTVLCMYLCILRYTHRRSKLAMRHKYTCFRFL